MFRTVENPDYDYQVVEIKKPSIGLVPVDQYDAQDFNLNEAGWIRNDISQLARAQSKAEFDMIMSRLTEIKSSGGLPDDISIDEAIKSIRPRWCQSPNELEQFAEWTNPDVMAKLDEAYQKSVKVPENDSPESPSESAD